MFEKLREIIRRFTDDNITITRNTVFLKDLGISSYELVELVCEVEREFDCDIPDRIINRFKVVQDILDYFADNNINLVSVS